MVCILFYSFLYPAFLQIQRDQLYAQSVQFRNRIIDSFCNLYCSPFPRYTSSQYNFRMKFEFYFLLRGGILTLTVFYNCFFYIFKKCIPAVQYFRNKVFFIFSDRCIRNIIIIAEIERTSFPYDTIYFFITVIFSVSLKIFGNMLRKH